MDTITGKIRINQCFNFISIDLYGNIQLNSNKVGAKKIGPIQVSFVKNSIDCWSLRKTTIPIGQTQNETQNVKNEKTFPIKFFLFLI
jgi:hypothetical protein